MTFSRAALAVPAALLTALLCSGASMTCGVPPASELPLADSAEFEDLGPADVIEVRIFNEPELSGVHQISESGTVRLPLVGVVVAQGLTPDELAAEIDKAYESKYLKDAQVSLFVKERNSQRVFVLGQVSKPGPVAFQGRMTIIEAIARAGGTSKVADPNRTLLTRDAAGKQLRAQVPVYDIGRGAAPDVQLQPGDIIFVPETPF